MEPYVPPVQVDIVWLGVIDDDVSSVVAGLYETLHRSLGLRRDLLRRPVLMPPHHHTMPGHWNHLGSSRDPDIPVLVGRPFDAIRHDVEATRDLDALRVVVALWPGTPTSRIRDGDEADAYHDTLLDLHECGALVIHVPLHRAWLGRLPLDAIPLRNHLFGGFGEQPTQSVIEEGVALAIAERLHEGRIQVFVSHAKADLPSTETLAIRILDHLKKHSRLKTFFDAQDLPAGGALRPQLVTALKGAVLLCVVGDQYADSPFCQFEMITAKLQGSPMVSVSALDEGEPRSLSFGGNHARLPWRAASDGLRTGVRQLVGRMARRSVQQLLRAIATPQPDNNDVARLDHIARLCLLAQLQHLHFHKVAEAVERTLPTPSRPVRLSRPPETLDFVLHPDRRDVSMSLLYPDPPLGQHETNLLMATNPRCRLVTPSTLYSTAVVEHETGMGIHDAPLKGIRVVFSMSDAHEDAPPLTRWFLRTRPTGFLDWHLHEAIAQVALTVARLGGRMAYGGHLASDGFTGLLVKLMERHNRWSGHREPVYSYLVPSVREMPHVSDRVEGVHQIDVEVEPYPGTAPDLVRIGWETTQMRRSIAYYEAPEDETGGFARRDLARECHARVCIGGKARPAARPQDGGYLGPFPGTVEEAWWMVASPGRNESPKPLYVLGGFGGAAEALAKCLAGAIPAELRAATFADNDRYRRLCEDYHRHLRAADETRRADERWHVPASLDEMAEQLSDYGQRLRDDDEQRLNGLTWEENLRLWSTRSPLEAATLLAKGLITWRRKRRPAGPLLVQAQRGDALLVEADAVGVASLEGLNDDQLVGFDRRVWDLMGREGAVPVPERGAATCLGLPSAARARHVMWSSLGALEALYQPDASRLSEAAKAAARDVVRRVLDENLRTLVTVPFGGNLNLGAGEAANAIVHGALEAMNDLQGQRLASLTICELDASRHRDVLRTLRRIERTEGSIVVEELTPQPGAMEAGRARVLHVTATKDRRLAYRLDVPRQAMPIQADPVEVDWAKVDEILGRVSARRRLRELSNEADRLRNLVIPAGLVQALDASAEPLEVRHDGLGGMVPLELVQLAAGDGDPLGWLAMRGLSRRPLELVPSPHLVRRDKAGAKVRVLLVADPTSDLTAARSEQQRLVQLLRRRPNVEVTSLVGQEATDTRVLEALATGMDVFHYAGHAVFDADDPARSGLRLHGATTLVAHHFAGLPAGMVPPLVFLNACRSARSVLRSVDHPGQDRAPTTVAEQLLASGVQNLIGSLWDVDDDAAYQFAEEVYDAVLGGRTIGAAVQSGRDRLYRADLIDAFNYVLYGEAGLRFVRPNG